VVQGSQLFQEEYSAAADDSVTVTMHDDALILRPGRQMDRPATVAFVGALRAAVEQAGLVVIDLELGAAEPDNPIVSAPTAPNDRAHSLPIVAEILVVGAGVVAVEVPGSWWMIDLSHRRLCRCAELLGPDFVDLQSWTTSRAVQITPATIRSVNADGSFSSTSRDLADSGQSRAHRRAS
jgi:hypothetical protein